MPDCLRASGRPLNVTSLKASKEELKMLAPPPVEVRPNPELESLSAIARLARPDGPLQDYFQGVMGILSGYFSIDYSALLLRRSEKDCLHVEALYGMARERHPESCNGGKGTMIKALQCGEPAVIQDLREEPFYEQFVNEKAGVVTAPLLCVPLLTGDEPLGVMNITPLYRKREFTNDFHFLSALSAVLSPAIKSYQSKKGPAFLRTAIPKSASTFLDEILEEKLTQLLNRIDPYLETKARMGILDDIITLIERIVIKSALERMGYVQTAAAQLLGINRNTLRKKMKELKIKAH
jgi:transcriptional regulator with GAF, ATPase, and Fis domain